MTTSTPTYHGYCLIRRAAAYVDGYCSEFHDRMDDLLGESDTPPLTPADVHNAVRVLRGYAKIVERPEWADKTAKTNMGDVEFYRDEAPHLAQFCRELAAMLNETYA